MASGVTADETFQADGVVSHPDAMGVGAKVGREPRAELGQNRSLAAGKRPLAFVDRRRLGHQEQDWRLDHRWT